MNARHFLQPAVIAGLTSACSLAPAYKTPSTDTAAHYKEAGHWQTATPADQSKRGNWWTVYHDSTLDSLQGRLDSANPDLAAAQDHYAQARAYLAQTRSGLFPELNLTGMTTANRQSDNRALRSASQPAEYGDNIIGSALTYEVDLWGRVRNLVAAGSANTQAAAADLANVRLSLHADLANDYIALRSLDAQGKLLADTVETYDHALKLTQNRQQGGASSGLDVARAQTQLENARALSTDIQAQRALYEHAIASLIGTSASNFSLPAKVTDLPIPSIPTSVPSALLQRRPDIAAAERRTAAANAQIGVARAAFYPTISLTATGGFEDTKGGGWLTLPNSYWAVGPHFNMALFDAGKRRAVDRQTQAAFDEAAEKYRSTTLKAFQQVEDNLATLHLLDTESRQQSAAVSSAENTLHLAMDRYGNGAVTYLEVVDSQTAALQARRAQLTLRSRQLQASVGLIRALGGGWSSGDLPRPEVATR